jgi:hypothetical protein
MHSQEPTCPHCGGELVAVREPSWLTARDPLQPAVPGEAGPLRFFVIAAAVLVLVAVLLAVAASFGSGSPVAS